MAATDPIRFASKLTMMQFLGNVAELLNRPNGEEFDPGLLSLIAYDFTGMSLPDAMKSSESEETSTPLDEDISQLQRQKRHARYVKMLVRLGASRKEATRLISLNSPTSRKNHIPRPADNAPVAEKESYDREMRIAISRLAMTAGLVGDPDDDTSPPLNGYRAVFDQLGWKVHPYRINAPDAPRLYLKTDTGMIPVFFLEWAVVPFETYDSETRHTLSRFAQITDALEVSHGLILFDQPMTMRAGGLYLTTIGLVTDGDKYSEILINEDCTSFSRLIELNEQVSTDPGAIGLLADRQMQIHRWYMEGEVFVPAGTFMPEAVIDVFPVEDNRWEQINPT